MREHPIPQDVTGYKFHIVGNMTLKQFAEVGAGVFVAVILYNTNLLPFIKWPLIIFFVGLGGMAAFVPIEERPLDHWITTFFRRLYSPTKFYWRKEPTIPFAMTTEKQVKQPEVEPLEVDYTPARQQRIKDYLASVSQEPRQDEWETAENSRVSAILQTFDQVTVKNVDSKPQAIKPQLTTRIRKLSPSQLAPAKKQTVFQADELIKSANLTEEVELEKTQPMIATPQPTDLKTSFAEKINSPDLTIPEPVAQETKEQTVTQTTAPVEIFADDQDLRPENTYAQPKDQATTNAKLPFPTQSLEPNAVVGMVLTPDNKLVDKAVVTIKDPHGKAIRAVKTNLLGQFFTTTPLPNGQYIVSVEKDGLDFPEKALVLNGSVTEPLELRAA